MANAKAVTPENEVQEALVDLLNTDAQEVETEEELQRGLIKLLAMLSLAPDAEVSFAVKDGVLTFGGSIGTPKATPSVEGGMTPTQRSAEALRRQGW